MKTSQKEIKKLIKSKVIEDITTATNEILTDLELEKVVLSFGIYGMNGGIFKSRKNGKLYGITARNCNLFRLA